MAPPSPRELEAIEQNQIEWSVIDGAEVSDEPDLGVVLVRPIEVQATLGFAVRIRWPATEVDERLDALEARLRQEGRWPSLVVADGLTKPAELSERLAAAGWSPVYTLQFMFTRHAPVVPHVDPGLRVEAVTPRTALEAVRVETEAFGMPEAQVEARAARLTRSLESGSVRGFLLRLVHEPVATARLATGAKVAGIHGIGVAPRHRRRGYGTMITAVATRAGLVTGHGLVWLSVETDNAAAQALYRALGYEPSFTTTRWIAPDR